MGKPLMPREIADPNELLDIGLKRRAPFFQLLENLVAHAGLTHEEADAPLIEPVNEEGHSEGEAPEIGVVYPAEMTTVSNCHWFR